MNLNSIKSRVYSAAKHGYARVLCEFLNDFEPDVRTKVLNEVYEDDIDQACTPLIIAAKKGHFEVCRLIIEKFNDIVNLEIEGTISLDNYLIEGVTALWCAAGSGHLNIVKLLVKAGSDINHATLGQSTPLRAACFDGRLDIVMYLVEHNADVNIANTYNNTCLMISAFKGHHNIVQYLLKNNVNVNARALCGATALHFASERGHLSIVKELMENGAIIAKNEHGMTALLSAAERTKTDVVEYIITRPEVTKEQKIEALELLGASYANDKESYNLSMAYHYLKKSMELRYSDSNEVIKKQHIAPVPAYQNWVECETLEELENIRINANSMHMESLTIRERILGAKNPDMIHAIVFRGAVFADNGQFDESISLWLHAIHLRQQIDYSIEKDLLNFTQLFSQMIELNVDLPCRFVIEVLRCNVCELQRNKEKLTNPGPKDDPETITENLESNLKTVLYIIIILTRLYKRLNDMEMCQMFELVHKLVRLNITMPDGKTLLHMVVNSKTTVDDYYISDVCKFPNSEATKLLIECGADVNAMDNERNTPLHLIVCYEKQISDFITLHSIITHLTQANAHIDTVNIHGKTPLEQASTGAEIILRYPTSISLKCMAAKVVNRHNVSYVGQVPRILEEFIELHSSGATK